MRPRVSGANRRGHRTVAIATRLALLALAGGAGLALLAHLVLASAGSTHLSNPAPRFAGPVFPGHLRAASFSLIDQNGGRATLAGYRGRVVVLTFMDSRPTGTSSVMTTEIRGALNELPAAGRAVPVLAISVDPAHDTRASSRTFLAREQMTGRMRFLLGGLGELRTIWKRYAIQPEVDAAGRRYRYGYSAFVLLIDRRGFLRVGFPAAQLVPEDLAHDLALLLAQRAK